jgi:hypothetical protein
MTVRSATELAARMRRMGEILPPGEEDMVKALGDLAKKTYRQVNHVRIPRSKKPVKWGGQITLLNGGERPSVKFRPTPTGMSQLVEGGSVARSWFEGSKHGGGSRKGRESRFLRGDATRGGRRAVLNIPGIGYRRFVVHPGIGPIAHPLEKTALALLPGSTKVINETITKPLIKRFQGG